MKPLHSHSHHQALVHGRDCEAFHPPKVSILLFVRQLLPAVKKHTSTSRLYAPCGIVQPGCITQLMIYRNNKTYGSQVNNLQPLLHCLIYKNASLQNNIDIVCCVVDYVSICTQYVAASNTCYDLTNTMQIKCSSNLPVCLCIRLN